MDFITMTTILSLLYIILAYFNIIRYFKLHLVDCNYFVSDYKLLDKASNNRCVIGLLNNNMKKVTPTINSLLHQTVSVNEIDLYTSTPINDCYLKQYVNIYNSSILHLFQKEIEDDTIIILLNTNTIYSEDCIEDFIESSKLYPNKVLYNGIDFNIENGVLLKSKYINPNIINELRGLDNIIDINTTIKKNLLVDTQSIKLVGNYKMIFFL